MDALRSIKTGLGRTLFASGLYPRFFSKRALVVCYHSVNVLGDSPLICRPDAFERYCEFFRRFFEPISLAELASRLRDGRDISRTVTLTFDDGYLDNYEVAAPILERHGLPATFFVTTSFLGTDHQAWWDTEAGVTSRWMTWDHARALVERGFEIGAHTLTHADLGRLPLDEARGEIDGSIEAVEAELGPRRRHFAIPFGGVDNVTEPILEYLSDAGLDTCTSTYAGLVAPDTSPTAIHRIPVVPWYRSPYQFGFEVAGLTRADPRPLYAQSRPG